MDPARGIQRANRPHYHIWKKARIGRIFYRTAAPYTHRQSAQRAVKKLGLPRGDVMVLECWDPKTAPRMSAITCNRHHRTGH